MMYSNAFSFNFINAPRGAQSLTQLAVRCSAEEEQELLSPEPDPYYDLEFDALLDSYSKDSESEPEPAQAPQTDDAARRLDEMVGLQRMKEEIQDAKTMALFNILREDASLCTDVDHRNHMLFLGNPGTGKTTVAKLIGEMFCSMGLLSQGHTVELSRPKLVGGFIGETEQLTTEAIAEARGGVLFIDEAYTLFKRDDDKDFGREVLNGLLPVLSEPNPDMIVILAGYPDKMEQLLEANEGLRDRFPVRIHFDDYSAQELMQIAQNMCEAKNFTLSEGAQRRMMQAIERATAQRDEYFGNGRWVENFVHHHLIRQMARRILAMEKWPTDAKTLSLVEECDVEAAEREYLAINITKKAMPERRKVGFTA